MAHQNQEDPGYDELDDPTFQPVAFDPDGPGADGGETRKRLSQVWLIQSTEHIKTSGGYSFVKKLHSLSL